MSAMHVLLGTPTRLPKRNLHAGLMPQCIRRVEDINSDGAGTANYDGLNGA